MDKYAVYIDKVEPIEGVDELEYVYTQNKCFIEKKGRFFKGVPAVYIDIGSGVIMTAKDYGWEIDSAQFAGGFWFIVDDKGVQHIPKHESMYFD